MSLCKINTRLRFNGTKINLIYSQQEKLDSIKLCKIELIEKNKTIYYGFQFDYCANNKKISSGSAASQQYFETGYKN